MYISLMLRVHHRLVESICSSVIRDPGIWGCILTCISVINAMGGECVAMSCTGNKKWHLAFMLSLRTTPRLKWAGKCHLTGVQEEEDPSMWWTMQCVHCNLSNRTLNIPCPLLAMLLPTRGDHPKSSSSVMISGWWTIISAWGSFVLDLDLETN